MLYALSNRTFSGWRYYLKARSSLTWQTLVDPCAATFATGKSCILVLRNLPVGPIMTMPVAKALNVGLCKCLGINSSMRNYTKLVRQTCSVLQTSWFLPLTGSLPSRKSWYVILCPGCGTRSLCLPKLRPSFQAASEAPRCMRWRTHYRYCNGLQHCRRGSSNVYVQIEVSELCKSGWCHKVLAKLTPAGLLWVFWSNAAWAGHGSWLLIWFSVLCRPLRSTNHIPDMISGSWMLPENPSGNEEIITMRKFCIMKAPNMLCRLC